MYKRQFYDNLTASTSENSWQNNCEYTQDELYELISGDNRTHLLSTQEASLFAGEEMCIRDRLCRDVGASDNGRRYCDD